MNARGIRRIKTGWQAYVRVRGRVYSRCFPLATSLLVMRRWREEQRVRVRLGATLPAPETTLREDMTHYLEQIQTMPTLQWRAADLALWLAVFGPDRDRRSITAGEIRAQLEKWRAAGYAASTCNHRRTALMHLWTVLDGRSATNPARDVPRYPEPPRPPQALTGPAIEALLARMPPSQTKARLALLALTGWPQAQMARLEPADIRWHEAVYVKPRRKGKGVAGTWLPLLPEAWTALEEFRRLGCWGPFSASSMRKSLRLAAEKARKDDELDKAIKAELVDVTPYQFRHSFLTLVAGITQDDRAVMVLAQHADIRTTHQYTSGTVDVRAAAAIRKVVESLALAKGCK